jgi:hypothetical protein
VPQEVAGAAGQQRTGVREPHPAALALDERLPDLPLEPRHRLGDRGRRHVQRPRGTGEAAGRGDGVQHTQPVEVEHGVIVKHR